MSDTFNILEFIKSDTDVGRNKISYNIIDEEALSAKMEYYIALEHADNTPVEPLDEATKEQMIALMEKVDPELAGMYKLYQVCEAGIFSLSSNKIYDKDDLRDVLDKIEASKTPSKWVFIAIKIVTWAVIVSILGNTAVNAYKKFEFGLPSLNGPVATTIGLGVFYSMIIKWGAPVLEYIIIRLINILNDDTFVTQHERLKILNQSLNELDRALVVSAKKHDTKFTESITKAMDMIRIEIDKCNSIFY